MSKHKEQPVGSMPLKIMVGMIVGAGIALILCVSILLAASFGISRGLLGEGGLYRITLFACVLSVLIGGTAVTRKCRSFWVGVGTGVVFYLCVLTIGTMSGDSVPLQPGGFGILAGSLIGGALAGFVGTFPRRGKRKRKSKVT